MKLLSLVLLLFVGCSERMNYPGISADGEVQRTASGLKFVEIAEGSGSVPQQGDHVKVHYSGFLVDSTKFDSSVDRDEPLTFVLGAGMVIAGWDEGVASMKVGGKRKLIIPSHLAYKERGIPGVIPANAELVFDVELLEVVQPEDKSDSN